uniref:5'-nucleotidase n=1 Tax=Ornithorhynchus anatinus TaxID=9258 RepID=A0A6I8PCQ7_ORNAN
HPHFLCLSSGVIHDEVLTSVLPFGGPRSIWWNSNGSTLLKAFEHSVHRYAGGSKGEFLQARGYPRGVRPFQAPWHRVAKIEVLCTKCRVPRYEPLKLDDVLQSGPARFLAQGGDNFQMIKDGLLKHDSGDEDLNVVSQYISKMEVIYPAVEGRINFLLALGSKETLSSCLCSLGP